ncbi:hypothetical protein M8J77_024541 [Diaphorina citri]|nr:hypothetical protein M8J77_024541 [Diaphorina citri]
MVTHPDTNHFSRNFSDPPGTGALTVLSPLAEIIKRRRSKKNADNIVSLVSTTSGTNSHILSHQRHATDERHAKDKTRRQSNSVTVTLANDLWEGGTVLCVLCGNTNNTVVSCCHSDVKHLWFGI